MVPFPTSIRPPALFFVALGLELVLLGRHSQPFFALVIFQAGSQFFYHAQLID
jgi:hypothetical protein